MSTAAVPKQEANLRHTVRGNLPMSRSIIRIIGTVRIGCDQAGAGDVSISKILHRNGNRHGGIGLDRSRTGN